MTTKHVRTRAGRPPTARAGDARAALLRAARELFSVRAFRAVSVRELAAAAGVNAAMVNYHFGGKEGIYEAMVTETVGPMLTQLEQAANGAGAPSLDQFLERYQAVLQANPWLPNLVVREVLYAEGRFRELFARRFAARAGAALAALVTAERARGRLRTDLDERLAALSLLSLTVFPFIARPLLERSLGMTMDEDFFARLARHNQRLFRNGTAAQGQSDKR